MSAEQKTDSDAVCPFCKGDPEALADAHGEGWRAGREVGRREHDSVAIPGVTVEVSIESTGDPIVLIHTEGDGGGQATICVSASGVGEDSLCALLRVVATTIEERVSRSAGDAVNAYAWGSGLSPLLPPTWPQCGVGGPREASSDCIRRERHDGEHEDSSGGTWPVAENPRYRSGEPA